MVLPVVAAARVSGADVAEAIPPSGVSVGSGVRVAAMTGALVDGAVVLVAGIVVALDASVAVGGVVVQALKNVNNTKHPNPALKHRARLKTSTFCLSLGRN
jgi:hypothetical protein